MKNSTKKFLGYLVVAIVYGVIITLLNMAGISFGALPTILILAVLIFLCNRIFKTKETPAQEQTTETNNPVQENTKIKMFEDYMKPEYLSKKIFTSENSITAKIGTPVTITLNVEGKPAYIFCNILGSSVTVDYQTLKWNGSKEITITPISAGETLLLFKADDLTACPVLVTVSADEAI